MFVEVGFGLLIFQAWRKAGSRGKITEEREKIYLAALEDLTDTKKLRELADQFEKEGCIVQAKMMRKRADLRDSTPALKAERRKAYEKGMNNWTNPDGIEALAHMFEEATATGAAAALRLHAEEVRAKIVEDARKAVADQKKQKASNDKKNGTDEKIVVEEVKQQESKSDESKETTE